MGFGRIHLPDLLIVLGLVVMVLGIAQALRAMPLVWSTLLVAAGLALMTIGIVLSERVERSTRSRS